MQINKTGLISLICGFLGLFLCWNKICIPFILLSFICGIISLTDYLGYKWPAICGIALALLGSAIVFIQIGLPFIKLYKIGEALSEIPSEVVTEKEYVKQATETEKKPQKTIENIVAEVDNTENIDNSFDEIDIVVNSIFETDERTEWEDPVEVVYVLNISINNKKHNGGVFYDLIASKVVDSAGQIGDERYSLRNDKDDIIQQGSCGECIIGVGLQHRGDFTITFYYYDDLATRHELEYTCNVD